LGEVNFLHSETHNNGMLVGFESICGYLEISSGRVGQFFSESYCVGFCPLAKMPSKNHFRVAFNRGEDPTIAYGFIFNAHCVLCFLLHFNILPLLIALNLRNAKPFYTIMHKRLATLASEREKIQDGSKMNASDARGRSKRATLNQMHQHTQGFI